MRAKRSTSARSSCTVHTAPTQSGTPTNSENDASSRSGSLASQSLRKVSNSPSSTASPALRPRRGPIPGCTTKAEPPRPAVDSHDPARLGVADPLRNQPNEPILLLHDHLTASGPPPSSHRNLPHTLGVVTLTGIRPPSAWGQFKLTSPYGPPQARSRRCARAEASPGLAMRPTPACARDRRIGSLWEYSVIERVVISVTLRKRFG